MGENASIIDPVDDPDLESIPFFKNVQTSLLRKRPVPIPRVRNQGPTYTCYAHVVTAVMYGDEVSRVGNSILASRQEFLDNIHKHHRPKAAIDRSGESGKFDVPTTGFPCSYPVAFDYVIEHGVSQDSEYGWIGQPKCSTYDGTKWDGKIVVEGNPIDKERKIFISGYKPLSTPDEIQSHLEKQPVAGCIKLTEGLRKWSSEKIYKGINAGAVIEKHAITLVGYGNEGDDHYYLCQNSFGLEWGYRGYFKASRDLITRTFIPLDTDSRGQRKKVNDDAMDDDAADVDADRMGYHALKKRRIL